MSTPNSSPVPANLEQQHKLAKDLIRAARDGDPAALARIQAVRSDAAAPPRPLKLADAQLAIAREAGFDSWPKLVADLQERDVKAFCDAVRGERRRHARNSSSRRRTSGKRINDPMFAFGQRAAHIAAKNEPLLTMLIAAGADVNLKSDWENGPYTVLDNADEDTARFLLARGATLTPNVAARLGWFDELQTLVDADSSARARARRRRSAAAARGEDGRDRRLPAGPRRRTSMCAASITSPRRRSTRWSIGRTSAGACSSAAPRPTSSWRPASGTSRWRRACWTPIRPASRSHQRARLRAGAAVQHLLLDARLRPVAARRRVEVRSSRCPRSARGPQPGAGPLHQRRPDRGRARRRTPCSPRIRRCCRR